VIRSRVSYKHEFSPCISGEIAHAYIKEAPELIWFRPEAEALSRIRDSIEANARWELSVWDDDKLLGVAIAVPDDDDHVGVCLSIQWRFILPEHRGLAGIKLQRAILHLAKRLGYPVVAYTKRIGCAKYELKYVRMRNARGQESKEDFQEDRPLHC
jgi:GNAT superfamily N-acetyltransferase